MLTIYPLNYFEVPESIRNHLVFTTVVREVQDWIETSESVNTFQFEKLRGKLKAKLVPIDCIVYSQSVFDDSAEYQVPSKSLVIARVLAQKFNIPVLETRDLIMLFFSEDLTHEEKLVFFDCERPWLTKDLQNKSLKDLREQKVIRMRNYIKDNLSGPKGVPSIKQVSQWLSDNHENGDRTMTFIQSYIKNLNIIREIQNDIKQKIGKTPNRTTINKWLASDDALDELISAYIEKHGETKRINN